MDDARLKPAETIGATDADANATNAADAPSDPARRLAMRKLGGYAMSVSPAMLVLANGRGNPQPSCDNPAWDLGLKRAGHSGC